MKNSPLVSIVVTNYNYSPYLGDAVDSALKQTYNNIEVLVVDDGSTDSSREIITSYNGRIKSLYKAHGGQTSAFNAGLLATHGEYVLFLDADDILDATVVEKAVRLFADHNVVKVHWPLWVVDCEGIRTGRVKPSQPVPEGDLREVVVRDGPESSCWPPTSGNMWSRTLLDRIFPLPEHEKQLLVGSASADAHLSMLAPLYGQVGSIQEPLAFYRAHSQNIQSRMRFKDKLVRDMILFEYRSSVLANHCNELGLAVDQEEWKKASWFYKVDSMVKDLNRLLCAGDSFILVDDGQLMLDESIGYRPIPFLEREGKWWGAPADDSIAVEELERLRRAGAKLISFAWPAFWWLEHYSGLQRYLRERFQCDLKNDRIIVFSLTHSQ